MNVFGVGSTELIVILLIAAIVLGPRRMVRLARDLGQLAQDLYKYSSAFRRELELLAEPEEQSQTRSETGSPGAESQTDRQIGSPEPAAPPASLTQEPAAQSEPGPGGSPPAQD